MRISFKSARSAVHVLGLLVTLAIIWLAGRSSSAAAWSPDAQKQIENGAALYKSRCVLCHSENLAGGAGPPLRGEDFEMRWNGKPLRALYSRILMTMPGNDPGSLAPDQVLTLVSFIASENSLAHWTRPFTSADDLNGIAMRARK